MYPQQLLDTVVVPTLKYMGGNYLSESAQLLMIATAAIESNCGRFVRQINGPALGIWQMEPATYKDIWDNADALKDHYFSVAVLRLKVEQDEVHPLIASPMYACAMARLKYAMCPDKLPAVDDIEGFWNYYKKIYNTQRGASKRDKFMKCWYGYRINMLNLAAP